MDKFEDFYNNLSKKEQFTILSITNVKEFYLDLMNMNNAKISYNADFKEDDYFLEIYRKFDKLRAKILYNKYIRGVEKDD